MINISNGVSPTPTVSDLMVSGDAIRTFFRLTVHDVNEVTDNKKFEVILKCGNEIVPPQQITLHHCTVSTNDGTRYQWELNYTFGATDYDNWKELYCKPFYDAKHGTTLLEDVSYPSSAKLYLNGENGFNVNGGNLYQSIEQFTARTAIDDTPQPALNSGVLTFFNADNSVYGHIRVTMALGAPTTRNEQY